MEYRATYPSPLGTLTLTGDGRALTGLWLDGRAPEARDDGRTVTDGRVPGIAEALLWLDGYFAKAAPSPSTVPLRLAGTPFQEAVWRHLLTVPYGTTTTYGAVARSLVAKGTRASAVAVGQAVGANPAAILVPCHRVCGADGSLTGYAGGLDAKAWLLAHEGVSL
ncbi:methylated-DNA--[protein]-cysteine S-methyltransferase [Caniella muris]|uniref:methylated-DNA--[protein]-cysteine S-methyltransferase n=1 Tax=Caniella muris TaxID=2941502 RepID=UPI00203B7A4C|nr:methylated-DNA--[protein]-cysteine S-methyltransferase [Caniella muris]